MSDERQPWRVRDLFDEPPLGHLSLVKAWSHVGGLVLSGGFLKQAWSRALGFDDFIGYAIGLALITTPALAAKFLGLKYGQKDTNGAAAPGGNV